MTSLVVADCRPHGFSGRPPRPPGADYLVFRGCGSNPSPIDFPARPGGGTTPSTGWPPRRCCCSRRQSAVRWSSRRCPSRGRRRGTGQLGGAPRHGSRAGSAAATSRKRWAAQVKRASRSSARAASWASRRSAACGAVKGAPLDSVASHPRIAVSLNPDAPEASAGQIRRGKARQDRGSGVLVTPPANPSPPGV